MTRMTKSISLVLISSAMILTGYGAWRALSEEAVDKKTDEEKDKEQRAAASRSTGTGSRGYFHPWYYGRSYSWGSGWSASRPSTSGSRPVTSTAVRSGGFGSTGHAVGS